MFSRKDTIEDKLQQPSINPDGTSVIDYDPEHEEGEYRIRAVDGLKFVVQRKTMDFSIPGRPLRRWEDAGFGRHDTIAQARQAFEHLMQEPVYLGKPDE